MAKLIPEDNFSNASLIFDYFFNESFYMELEFQFVLFSQGEAKSAQLIGQAIANNPAFITLRKIEAARDIAHTISNSANKAYLSADDLLLNLQDLNLNSTGRE